MTVPVPVLVPTFGTLSIVLASPFNTWPLPEISAAVNRYVEAAGPWESRNSYSAELAAKALIHRSAAHIEARHWDAAATDVVHAAQMVKRLEEWFPAARGTYVSLISAAVQYNASVVSHAALKLSDARMLCGFARSDLSAIPADSELRSGESWNTLDQAVSTASEFYAEP